MKYMLYFSPMNDLELDGKIWSAIGVFDTQQEAYSNMNNSILEDDKLGDLNKFAYVVLKMED